MTDGQQATPLDALLGAAPGRRQWATLLLLVVAVLGAAAFLVRFVMGDDSPYYTAVIERGDLVPKLSLRGELRLEGEVVIPAEDDGRVAWMTGETGAIARGHPLLRFDRADARRDAELAAAQASAVAAQLEAAEISAQEVSARLERFEGVWRRSGGRAPSLNEMETARADFRRAELAREAARAQVSAARIRMANARAALRGGEVRAPIAGTVIRRLVTVGQTVRAGQPLFTMAAGKAPLVLDVALPSFTPSTGAALPPGTSASVHLDSLPSSPQAATLRRLIAAQREARGPARAVFALDRPDPRAGPGMTATVEIELPARRSVLLVPDAALATLGPAATGGRASVLVIDEDGQPRRIDVTAGASDGKRTEVSSAALLPGAPVVIGWRSGTGAVGDRLPPVRSAKGSR